MFPGRINEKAHLCSKLGTALLKGLRVEEDWSQNRSSHHAQSSPGHNTHTIQGTSHRGALSSKKHKGSSVTALAILSASCIWSGLWVVDTREPKDSLYWEDNMGGLWSGGPSAEEKQQQPLGRLLNSTAETRLVLSGKGSQHALIELP